MRFYKIFNNETRYYFNNENELNAINDKYNVKLLYINGDNLCYCPNFLQFNNLEIFEFSYNNLFDFYRNQINEISNLPITLKNITCNYNKLIKLPELNHLINLEEINFKHNWLKTVPELKNCINLKLINFNFNRIKLLPEFPINVKKLHLNYNFLSELPDLSMLINLTYLDCSSNKLTKLPDLSMLINLTYLDCSSNKLDIINNLPITLSFLDCSQNNLTQFNLLFKLKKCKEVYFYNNKISYVPKNIIKCKHLQTYIKFNTYKLIYKLNYLLNTCIAKYYNFTIYNYYNTEYGYYNVPINTNYF